MTTLVATAVVLLGTGASVLIVRSGGEEPAAAPSPAVATSPVRVLVPGRPGESARVTGADQVRAPDGSTYNSIDTAFAQMMIVHHQQATRMAGLAPGRAGNVQLRALADRMAVAQKGEITVLRNWLQTRKLPDSDPAHDHSTMPGMQTEAAIAELAAARGADFDRRFVTMMTAHHRGAQQMAADVLRGGTDQSLSEMANEMAVEQVSEIRRMADLGVS
ncbi:MAG TPA: DUF305 domain-containing protein [Actinoplanes sp.]|nr:DUF305 domain-containing protein [Actinoplanes sp.]